MKIYRPLWEDGAFLAPQQFQQQARWDAHVADTVARMALANPWGVLCAEFDEGALALSRLNATRLCVRFADGTLVDTDLADTRLRSGSRYAAVAISGAAAGDDAAGTDGGGNGGAGAAAGTGYAHAGLSP